MHAPPQLKPKPKAYAPPIGVRNGHAVAQPRPLPRLDSEFVPLPDFDFGRIAIFPSSNGKPEVTSEVGARIQALCGGGRPLPPATRAYMEPRFGHDFSRVRVHIGARAAETARAVNAQAFTVGRDVVFGAGQQAPDTQGGRRLLAHELAHVVQRGGSKSYSGSQIYRNGPIGPINTGDNSEKSEDDTEAPENYCVPYATREEGLQVREKLLEGLAMTTNSWRFHSSVIDLFRDYLNGTSKGVRDLSGNKHIVDNFAQDWETEARQKELVEYVGEHQSVYARQLRGTAWTSFAVESIIPTKELEHKLNYTQGAAFTWLFNDIPGLIAGGVGPKDKRIVTGSVLIRRTTGIFGSWTGVEVMSNLRFGLKDIIDFCPPESNNPGSWFAQWVFTVEASRLEAQRLAKPLAFKLDYYPDSIKERF